LILLFCSAVHAIACNNDSVGRDGGDADRDAVQCLDGWFHDANVGGDDAGVGDDGWSAPDEDLGEDFALIIPPGIRACGTTRVHMGDLPASFQGKGRVALRPGLYRLYKEADIFEADLVESVELGPEAVVATPEGPGYFTLSPPEGPDGEYTYWYDQAFQASGKHFQLSLVVYIRLQDGIPRYRAVTLDDGNLCDHVSPLFGDWGGDSFSFGPCRHTRYECAVYEYWIGNGDKLKAESCQHCPAWYICKADLAELKRAAFARCGGGGRYVGDYYDMAKSMRHHNWGFDILVRFEEPLDGIYGLYLETGTYSNPGTWAHYLDEDLAIFETHPLGLAWYQVDW
jgi:hypothetical protein